MKLKSWHLRLIDQAIITGIVVEPVVQATVCSPLEGELQPRLSRGFVLSPPPPAEKANTEAAMTAFAKSWRPE
jgi:hypothetical protein